MLGNGLVHGMYNPSAVWADDSAIYFDGVNDYTSVTCDNSINLPGKNDTTLSLWCKSYSATISADFVIWQHTEISGSNDANQYLWYDQSAAQIKFTRTNAGGISATTSIYNKSKVDMATWNHIVVTIDADGDMVISVNAEADDGGSSATSPGAWTAGDTKFYYGSSVGTSNFFNGYISNVVVWTEILDDDAITDIYNADYPKNELENNNDTLFFYHVSNERTFISDTGYQIATHAIESTMRRVVYSGAIVVSKPEN